MKLSAKKISFNFKKNDVIALFMSDSSLKGKSGLLPGEFSYISDNVDLDYFKATKDEIFFLPFIERPGIILCGLGKIEEITTDILRSSASSVSTTCIDKGIKVLNAFIPEIESIDEAEVLRAISEGLILGNYSFDKYKSKDNTDKKTLIEKAFLFCQTKGAGDIVTEAEVTANSVLQCRNLVNDTSENSNPSKIVSEAKKIAKLDRVTCKVLGKDDIEKLGMGLLHAVNKGSSIPPQLVVLKYAGNPASDKNITIVGKGITFDSGGLNLKTSGHIETMRMDMAGAAAALYTLKAVAELKLAKNVNVVMPLTENMLSNESYRPGDVFKAFNGKTVEVGNTDAEGRLILADALSYSVKELQPDCILDIATLTGACVATFGEHVAGMLANNDKLSEVLEKASILTGEKIWRLPLLSVYEEALKSDIADLNNISSDKNSGTITAAAFLKNFVDDCKWAHLDIAGTAWFSKKRSYTPKNATGFGVRLLIETIKNWSDK